MKFWDCFTFNGEFECLQIRCEELKPLNAHHVLVDGKYSFTGNRQRIPFYEKESKEDFFEYDIQEYVVEELHNLGDAWENERHQRDCILTALKELGAKDDDIVIVSDADEIPAAKAIQSYVPEMGLTALKMDNFWYKFNCLTEIQSWLPARIMTYGYLKNTTPNEARNSGYQSVIENGGWHFSYLGNIDYIINKLQSFSHTEYNKAQYKDRAEIARKIDVGEALWGTDKFRFVSIDKTFPKYLYENQEKFKQLIQAA